MMRNFKVELHATGDLTQLPDSQKLFGALIYLFADTYGNKNATMLTEAVFNKDVHIALSNVLPLGKVPLPQDDSRVIREYLPVPQDYLINKLSSKIKDTKVLKEKRAAIKQRSFIQLSDLQTLFEQPESCDIVFPYVKLQHSQQLRASIDSVRYDIPELDSNLYSVPTVHPVEVYRDGNDIEQQRTISSFYFYVQVDGSNHCDEFLDMLKTAVSENTMLILGKRASQGLNTFQLFNIKQETFDQQTNLFLNTGMLLPDKIDFGSSTLKLFTSKRRPFDMFGGWDKNLTKYYISFLDEGSVISVPDEVLNAGKSLRSPFSQRDIVFGNAFLYPIQQDSGRAWAWKK